MSLIDLQVRQCLSCSLGTWNSRPYKAKWLTTKMGLKKNTTNVSLFFIVYNSELSSFLSSQYLVKIFLKRA